MDALCCAHCPHRNACHLSEKGNVRKHTALLTLGPRTFFSTPSKRRVKTQKMQLARVADVMLDRQAKVCAQGSGAQCTCMKQQQKKKAARATNASRTKATDICEMSCHRRRGLAHAYHLVNALLNCMLVSGECMRCCVSIRARPSRRTDRGTRVHLGIVVQGRWTFAVQRSYDGTRLTLPPLVGKTVLSSLP